MRHDLKKQIQPKVDTKSTNIGLYFSKMFVFVSDFEL